MIEINLLPEEARLKAEKKRAPAASPAPVTVSDRKLLLVFPSVVALMLAVHCVLGAVQLVGNARLGGLAAQWKTLEPERKKMTDSDGTQDDRLLAAALKKTSVRWSKKLNVISRTLPEGVWFTDLSLGKKELFIRGSVFSLEKNEIELLNTFMADLKHDADFLADFTGIELGSLQARRIGGYDAVDFTLTMPLKSSK